MSKTNRTMDPDMSCLHCLYEDEMPDYHICKRCARNNLSGFYNDEYVYDDFWDDDLDDDCDFWDAFEDDWFDDEEDYWDERD